MSAIAETEHARSEQLDNPESIYRACADMKLFNQVLRVILLDTRYRRISTVEITKGSINESLAHPRDIFRPVIGQSAYAFVLVPNLCGAPHRLCGLRIYVRCAGVALEYEPFQRGYLNQPMHIISPRPWQGGWNRCSRLRENGASCWRSASALVACSRSLRLKTVHPEEVCRCDE